MKKFIVVKAGVKTVRIEAESMEVPGVGVVFSNAKINGKEYPTVVYSLGNADAVYEGDSVP